MKKLFFGLLIAATGLSASALTNNSRFATFYITSQNADGSYNWTSTPRTCPGGSDPCSFVPQGSYTPPSSGVIPAADINNPAKVLVTEQQSL